MVFMMTIQFAINVALIIAFIYLRFYYLCLQVKATIQHHRGDLEAAETACAQLELGLEELTPTSSSCPSRKRPQQPHQDPDSALLESLQSQVVESGTILKDLSKAQQPITARTTFANYVRDSLVTMSKVKYKKARSNINKFLSDLIDEESEEDIPSAMGPPLIHKETSTSAMGAPPKQPCTSTMGADGQPSHLQIPPLRSSSTPSFGSAPSHHYQPPPHLWRHVPPVSSVWGSQSIEYMDQYQQQPLQQPLQQQMPPQMPPHCVPPPVHQAQQKCTPTPTLPHATPVSAALFAAGQVLRDQPTPSQPSPSRVFDQSLSNISALSNISGLSGNMGSPLQDLGSHQDGELNTP